MTIEGLFNDPFLRDEIRFRGGTALNKLHFPKPLRYSEDIDLTRTKEGPSKPIWDRVTICWIHGWAILSISAVRSRRPCDTRLRQRMVLRRSA